MFWTDKSLFLKKAIEKMKETIENIAATDEYISNYGSYDDCDVNVKIARHNYKMYQDDLKRLQRSLIEKWCKKIREVSRSGGKYIDTNNFVVDDDWNRILYLVDDAGQICDFPPNSSIQYFQDYFEEKGFNVMRLEYHPHGFCGLRIRWLD